MPTCTRCANDVGFLGRLSFNNQTKRCGSCEREVQQSLNRFRQSFIDISHARLLTEHDWQTLTQQAQYERLDLGEALAFIRGDALHFLERTLTFFYSDGAIAEDEEQYIRAIIHHLDIPDDMAEPVLQRLTRLKFLTNIRKGHLPVIRPSIHLESDEICYMETGTIYHKVNAKSVSYIEGRLIATNKKLQFLSSTGGAEIPLKRIMRVDRQNSGVYLELSTKKGNGLYAVHDPEMAEAIIDTLTRMAKRQLLAPKDETATRHIPQDVKQAVWQRDQGKCVQCRAATYLEFDHIIPFSKGGANTIQNVQLLCRKCNLSKGGRL